MSGRRAKPALSTDQLSIVWQSVSLLLDYPDEQVLARAELVRSAARGLPAAIGDSLRDFLDHLESTPLPELQADYVETFDNRRRCNLFLTYFAHGDTRKRGWRCCASSRPTSGPGSRWTTPSSPTTCASCSSSLPRSTATSVGS